MNIINEKFKMMSFKDQSSAIERIDKIVGKDTSRKDKWQKIKTLGHPGKEGVTYLVTNEDGKSYAMKTFRKTKSANRIREEKSYQEIAAKAGVSPSVIDYDIDHKYIVMDLLDDTLLNIVRKQGGQMSRVQEKQIYKIYEKLDEIGVFHNDANPLNLMLGKDGKMYAIDFGFSKFITPEYDMKNTTQMTAALIIWLRKFFPEMRATYLVTKLEPKLREELDLRNKSST